MLTWNDWQAGGTQALELYLLDQDGNVIASSRNSREGNRPPLQQIVYKFDEARTYYVAIHGVNVTQPVMLNLFMHQTPLMELSDPVGSLATPGDAAEALTVGAVNWRSNQLEAFSSRGPTADGRPKPDLVGPDGVSNAIYAPQGFYGTSAATPHIAGAAALVWSAYPQATTQDVRNFLINNAIDLEAPGLDNDTGAGLLVLADPPPQPTPVPPTPTVATRRAHVHAAAHVHRAPDRFGHASSIKPGRQTLVRKRRKLDRADHDRPGFSDRGGRGPHGDAPRFAPIEPRTRSACGAPAARSIHLPRLRLSAIRRRSLLRAMRTSHAARSALRALPAPAAPRRPILRPVWSGHRR